MDPKGILEALKKASPVDVFLVSFFLLPFAFQAWNDVLESVGFSSKDRLFSVAVLFALYIIALIAMLVSTSRSKRREIAKDQILAHLAASRFERVSNEGIRRYISPDYTDEFIEAVLSSYPRVLRYSRVKGGPGIAGIAQDEAYNNELQPTADAPAE